MVNGWLGYIFIFAIATLSQCSAQQEEQCFRPTAAVNIFGIVCLFDGNRFIIIDSSFTEVENGTAADTFGYEGEIDAAYMDTEYDLYFNLGTKYYSHYWGEGTLNNSDLNPFFADGLDAAGFLGGKNYFFKGCKYLIRGKNEEDQEGDMKSLELPCDVDAAWKGIYDKLYVTKEGEYWSMDKDGHVTGPEKLSKLLTLISKEVCEKEEDIYTIKIEDEQEYEKEHNCVIIDAATARRGRIYLFNDDEYLAFNRRGQQYRRAPISNWGGLVPNIDAAVVWSGNHMTYFFKGAQFYSYTKSGVHGPHSNELWSSRFLSGVDAAGNYNGHTHFFQGCEILRYPGPSSEVDHVTMSEDVGLPCNVDAAFTSRRYLFVIKFNQVWFLNRKGAQVSGPKDLTSILHVKSWNLCSLQ